MKFGPNSRFISAVEHRDVFGAVKAESRAMLRQYERPIEKLLLASCSWYDFPMRLTVGPRDFLAWRKLESFL